MKKIIELLKSLKFWSIVAGIAAVISAVVALIPYLRPEEPLKPTVYIGKVDKKYQLETEDRLCVNYLIPTKYKEKKSVLPFPIIIQNSERQNINDFYVEFSTLMKAISENEQGIEYMQRFFPYADYERKTAGFDSLQNKLLIENIASTSIVSGKQYRYQKMGNKGHRIVFLNNDVFSDLLALNVSDNENENPWDVFTIDVEMGTNETVQRFEVEIRCFFVDDETTIPEKLEGANNYIIRPVYRGKAVHKNYKDEPFDVALFTYDSEKISILK